jgi:hypothetical protein
MFIDTHIVSNFKRGRLTGSVRGASISSVVASELLLVYGKSRTSANYYVPVGAPRHIGASLASHKLDHPFSAHSTDRIVFSFGSDFPPLLEFGSNALAKVINDRNFELLRQSIAFLEKRHRKIIYEDFSILVENEIHCVPLTPASVRIGYQLLRDFQSLGEPFKTTFRNTWNDLLILATAKFHGEGLLSEDKQLNRVAADCKAECVERGSGLLEVRFPDRGDKLLERSESKGYVNRGWKASFSIGGKKSRIVPSAKS